MFKQRQIRKYLQWFCYYLLPLGLIATSLFIGLDKEFYVELGEPALNLLIFILFLTPVTQILDWKTLKILMAWRREFGVASFWFFLFHAAGLMYVDNLTNINDYLNPQGYLFWGAIAGIGMLILGLTSNNTAVKLLRRNWKRLQYIAIPTLFFAQAHASLADEGSILPAILLFAVYLLLRIIGSKIVKKRLEQRKKDQKSD